MYKHPLFISWTLLLLTMSILHILALEFSLYWFYSWFDIVVHFLGGFSVGLLALWFFFESGYVHLNKSIQNVILTAGSSIILVGVGWEIFELLAGIPIEDNFIIDTAVDLIMDALGTIIAGFIFIKIYLTKKESGHEEQYQEKHKEQ